jgi:hypothetical protein
MHDWVTLRRGEISQFQPKYSRPSAEFPSYLAGPLFNKKKNVPGNSKMVTRGRKQKACFLK